MASGPTSVAVHHVGLCPRDMGESLRFYRDGLGLDVLFDVTIDTNVEPLLGVRTTQIRTVFVGSADGPDQGHLELIDLGTGHAQQEDPAPAHPHRGLFLLSFQLPVEAALTRLAALGLGGTPRRMSGPRGGLAATVVDPDGVVVELLDQPLTVGR